MRRRRLLGTNRFTPQNRDVGQVNSSAGSDKQGYPSSVGRQLPPVLASVPWLAGPSETELRTKHCQANLLEPHSLLASPELGVADCNAQEPKYRFDPPQVRATNLSSHNPPHAGETKQADLASVSDAKPRNTTFEGQRTTTQRESPQFRFDKPAVRVEQKQEVPDPVTMESKQPSTWHHTVANIDNIIRKYNRIIVVAALVTAAGLMLLVLEGNQPPAEPVPDNPDPASDRIAAQPEPFSLSGIPPLKFNEEEAGEESETASARGPRSQARRRVATAIHPIQQFDERQAVPLELTEPIGGIEVPGQVTTESVRSEPTEKEVDGPALQMSNYPSTMQPQSAWPAFRPTPGTDEFNRPVARLSRELKPVEEARRQ